MQNRQDRDIVRGIQKLVRVPARGKRACLRLAVSDDTSGNKTGIVEDGAISMSERVTKFTALIDRSRSLRRGVTRNTARKGELAKQLFQPFGVL